jgi:hypothetical protein
MLLVADWSKKLLKTNFSDLLDIFYFYKLAVDE